jgi:hypothetical protein
MRGVADSRLWGNARTLQVGPTLGPTRIDWGEVARIEGPHPTSWNLFGRLANNGGQLPFDPADLAAGSFTWVLAAGTGMIQVPLSFAVAGVGSPNVAGPDNSFTFQASGLPAQWVTSGLIFTGPVAVGGFWSLETWGTPLAGWFDES